MDVTSAAERAMGMSDAVWARHASPWSVWSRFTCLPLLALAVWSRVWLGWWALVPVALALFWIWWNPRAFPPPARTDNWASKGTFGERVYLNRKAVPIPAHHELAASILAAGSGPGAVLLVYGLADLHLWATLFGLFATMVPKIWFVDRMAWLYQDMRDATPEYASWLKT